MGCDLNKCPHCGGVHRAPCPTKAVKDDLILWGFHPSHGNVPLKLEAYSRKAMERRTSEGWKCGAYADGDEPAGLALMAQMAQRVAETKACGLCGLESWKCDCTGGPQPC